MPILTREDIDFIMTNIGLSAVDIEWELNCRIEIVVWRDSAPVRSSSTPYFRGFAALQLQSGGICMNRDAMTTSRHLQGKDVVLAREGILALKANPKLRHSASPYASQDNSNVRLVVAGLTGSAKGQFESLTAAPFQ